MKNLMKAWASFAAVALFAFSSISWAAEYDAEPEKFLTEFETAAEPVFVTPPSPPTAVQVTFSILRVTNVAKASNNFPTAQFEVFLALEWLDPRLAFDAEAEGTETEAFLENDAQLKLDRIWWPDITVQNEYHKREIENIELLIRKDGAVTYKERSLVTVSLDFDYHHFPFDDQIIYVDLESFAWDDKSVILVPKEGHVGVAKGVEIPGWEITAVDTKTLDVHESRGDNGFSKIRVEIAVSRDPGYHVKTVIIPLLIILIVLVAVVFSDIEKRIEYILIALLAMVAFHGIISENLPGLSDFIMLDVMVLVGYVSSLIALIEAVAVQRLNATGRPEAVAWLEDANRKWLPRFVVVSVVGSFVLLLV